MLSTCCIEVKQNRSLKQSLYKCTCKISELIESLDTLEQQMKDTAALAFTSGCYFLRASGGFVPA